MHKTWTSSRHMAQRLQTLTGCQYQKKQLRDETKSHCNVYARRCAKHDGILLKSAYASVPWQLALANMGPLAGALKHMR